MAVASECREQERAAKKVGEAVQGIRGAKLVMGHGLRESGQGYNPLSNCPLSNPALLNWRASGRRWLTSSFPAGELQDAILFHFLSEL
jgi:hypothetical protein